MADKMNRKIREIVFQAHYIDVFIVISAALKVCLASDLSSGRRGPEFEIHFDGLQRVLSTSMMPCDPG